ncbi:hypothetical protein VM98_14355 [Streptomyces rubellomurinus subsp. indigoferus]|nr:hypothetical protein VM98_14355 [Streptomyces rubellomurinus subsp. indigoferus]
MDGVLMPEGTPIPGAEEFPRRLRESGNPLLVLTDNVYGWTVRRARRAGRNGPGVLGTWKSLGITVLPR